MTRKFLIVVLVLTTVILGFAQVPKPEYSRCIKKADSLYKTADYRNSGVLYALAFKSFGWKGYLPDRYNAARSWTLALLPDSAFSNLERIALKGNYSNYDQLVAEKDFISLHKDARWLALIAKVKSNKDKSEINFDLELIKSLEELVREDQKWRNYLTKYDNNQLGNDTISRKYILLSSKRTDSLNFQQLMRIFQKYGFPNFDIVGTKGSNDFWLLVQHQDSHLQFQEEVLPKMKAEAEKGKASLSDYAYLLDRVKVNKGELQVYGTQMKLNSTQTSYEPKPVVNADKLNERRQSVGLSTIESYIEMMNSRYFGTLKKK